MTANIDRRIHSSISGIYAVDKDTESVAQSMRPRTVWDRIEQLLKEAGMKGLQPEAAKIARCSQPAVSAWNTPTGAPALDKAIRLALHLNACVEWIYTERGPKRPGEEALDAIGRALWDVMAGLSEEERQTVLDFARFRQAQSKKTPATPPRKRKSKTR